jgi:TDG/mug DNA glycosylase family protein
VLFSGINPSLRTAWTGHHFAHPANRFWLALHLSGFTPRRLAPSEQEELLGLGLGVTNIAARASARASELTVEELREGGVRLAREVEELRPRWLAVLGVTAYRTAFAEPRATLGPQERTIGTTRLWVLPNPSGLNAHHTPAQLGERFAELLAAVEEG